MHKDIQEKKPKTITILSNSLGEKNPDACDSSWRMKMNRIRRMTTVNEKTP